jgi:hypothetical protein
VTPEVKPGLHLGPPVVKLFESLRESIPFLVDDAHVWVASGSRLSEYDGTQLKQVELAVDNHDHIHTLVSGAGRLFLATTKNGLIEFDTRQRTSRRYGVADGLLMPDVAAMQLSEDRLWLGFAERVGHGPGARLNRSWLGGVSYLDLKTGRFTGFSPELKTNLTSLISRGAENPVSVAATGLARAPVEHLKLCSADSLWAANQTSGIQQFNFVTRTWMTPKVAGRVLYTVGSISTMDVTDDYLAVGGQDIRPEEPDGDVTGVFVLDRRTNQSWRLTLKHGLPSNSILAVALLGPHLWIGGRGWLAVADLASGTVQRVQHLPGLSVGRIQAARGQVWFSAGGHLYRVAQAF